MKILIVDDHALFREGLLHVLQKLETQVDILEASDYDSALEYVSANHDLDLVLLDLTMPGRDGFAALDTFAKQYPAMPVVILSASNLRSDIQRALDAGAVGYILKESNSAVMLNALKLILAGGIYMPPVMAQEEAMGTESDNAIFAELTPRQIEVLKMLVNGHSNKTIAARLGLAEATVKMHVTAILSRLGVSNRTQAALQAEKMGLNLL
jgi:DNA-binding NarL/FixJ family response regulator